MIVCNCKAASERDVHSAIDCGAESLADLRRCGIGGDCGTCHDDLRAMLRRHTLAASFIPTSLHPNIPTDTLAP